jgi:catechol 2,3-dioxygenase-like lactoylglutathione lyase family enzyme
MTALVPHTRLSHGTIECMDHKLSRRFYEEVLGLGSVRPLPAAQYLWKGGPWSLVCVGIGVETKPQGVENRFCLRVDTPEEVDAARDAALRLKPDHNIREVGPIETKHGVRSFVLCDRDCNWWEVSNVSGDYYDDVFLRGDVTN